MTEKDIEDSSDRNSRPNSSSGDVTVYVTVQEAAICLRRSPKTIRRWINAGYLQAAKLNRGWLLEWDQIQTLLDWYGKRFPRGILIQRRWLPPFCPRCRDMYDALRGQIA